MRRLERVMPSSAVFSAYRPWQSDVRSDPAILFSHTAGAAELDLAALRLGTRTGLALNRLYGKTRKHGLNGSDLTSDCHGLELALVDASGITRSSRLTECSAVGACAGFPLRVTQGTEVVYVPFPVCANRQAAGRGEGSSGTPSLTFPPPGSLPGLNSDTGDVDRLRPQRRLPIRWHEGRVRAGTVGTIQATFSSLPDQPKKREDCLNSERRSREGEFRSAGWAGKDGGRFQWCPHAPAPLSIGTVPPATEIS